MFRMLAEMLGGGHEALPGRRRAAPSIAFDPTVSAFVADEADERPDGTWLGRGELPGHVRVAPAVAPQSPSIVEEMQRLARAAAAKDEG